NDNTQRIEEYTTKQHPACYPHTASQLTEVRPQHKHRHGTRDNEQPGTGHHATRLGESIDMCDDSGVRKGHKEHKQPNGQDLRVDDRLEAELHGCSWFPALIHIWFGIRSAHEHDE